jgi:hypothetical protein
MTMRRDYVPLAVVGSARARCPACRWRRRLSTRRVFTRYRHHWLSRHAGLRPWSDPAYPHVRRDVQEAYPRQPERYVIGQP